MSEKTDYGQLFCESVDTIVEQRLSQLHFDLTKTCIITDDSEAEKGKYRVKMLDGTSEFYAYSTDTTFKVKDSVYVQIPSGDMNEQKIIVSKKLDDKGTPLSYQSPFETYLGITGNLISNSDVVTKGLTANENIIEGKSEGYINYENVIWAYVTSDEAMKEYFDEVSGEYKCEVDLGDPLSKYSVLGIQAQFKSWLGDRYLTKGSYGLKLRIAAEAEDANEEVPEIDKPDSEEAANQETIIYEFTLDCADMVGDIYNFISHTEQEQVFNIKDIYQIKRMELIFYQANNFKDKTNQLINQQGEDDPNLFVKDISISLGYDASEFDEDQVFIYTLDSPKYNSAADNEIDNHRQLEVRWIHKNQDGKVYIVKVDDDIDYKMTWYKYSLGSYSHHPKVGADWKPLSVQFSNKRFSLITTNGDTDHQDPDALGQTEETKENKYQFNILDKDWLDYNNSAELGYRREPGENRTWFIPDISLSSEKARLLVSYLENPDDEASRKYLLSNIIELSNRKEVVSKPTVDAVTALTIECQDGSNGNYLIYDQGNNLLDLSIGSQEKQFVAKFRGAELKNAEYIEWILPKDNSMIVIDDNYLGADFTDNKDANKIKEFKEKIKNGDSKNNDVENGFYHVYRFGDSMAKDKYNIEHANKQRYKIRSYYSSAYNNNTIQCKVRTKDGITYTATKTLLFGPSGTSGSDHTLIISFDEDNINGIAVKPSVKGNAAEDADFKNWYNLRARLYTYEGQEVDFNAVEDYTMDWELQCFSERKPGLALNFHYEQIEGQWQPSSSDIDNRRSLELQVETESDNTKTYLINMNQLYIIKVTLKWRDNQNLIAYLPIPLKLYEKPSEEEKQKGIIKVEYGYITGADRVIYKADGIPYFSKTPYGLYKTVYSDNSGNQEKGNLVRGEDSKIDDISWQILQTEIGEKISDLYPQIDVDEYEGDKLIHEGTLTLKPLPFYVEDQPMCGVQAYTEKDSGTVDEQGEKTYIRTVFWTQPLLILMNRYPNGAINRWDGKTLKIDEENGSIIGTAFAAGKKEQDGTFSGVMLGDWKRGAKGDVGDSIGSTTGVYGLHRGAVSYAFKEDGKAFIGKSGHGRINFNGDSGAIYSSSWESLDPYGMNIDLDNGDIQMIKKIFAEDSYTEVDDLNKIELNKVYYIKNDMGYTVVNQDNIKYPDYYYIKIIDEKKDGEDFLSENTENTESWERNNISKLDQNFVSKKIVEPESNEKNSFTFDKKYNYYKKGYTIIKISPFDILDDSLYYYDDQEDSYIKNNEAEEKEYQSNRKYFKQIYKPVEINTSIDLKSFEETKNLYIIKCIEVTLEDKFKDTLSYYKAIYTSIGKISEDEFNKYKDAGNLYIKIDDNEYNKAKKFNKNTEYYKKSRYEKDENITDSNFNTFKTNLYYLQRSKVEDFDMIDSSLEVVGYESQEYELLNIFDGFKDRLYVKNKNGYTLIDSKAEYQSDINYYIQNYELIDHNDIIFGKQYYVDINQFRYDINEKGKYIIKYSPVFIKNSDEYSPLLKSNLENYLNKDGGTIADTDEEDNSINIFGKIYQYNSEEYSKISFRTDEEKKEFIDLNPKVPLYILSEDNTSEKKYITLSVDENIYPFAIGTERSLGSRNFRVKWDGTCYINNGYFSGRIEAEEGEIGGWTIGKNTLTSANNKVVLDSAEGSIKGAKIYANYFEGFKGVIGGWIIGQTTLTSGQKDSKGEWVEKTPSLKLDSNDSSITGGILKSPTNNGIQLQGFFTVAKSNGDPIGKGTNYIGAITSNIPELDSQASGVGFSVTNSSGILSIVKSTEVNVGMSYGDISKNAGGYISITSEGIHIDGKPNLIIGAGDNNSGGVTLNGDKITIGDYIGLEKTEAGNNKITFYADAANQYGIYARFAGDDIEEN